MKIHNEGYPTIILVIAILLIAVFVFQVFLPEAEIIRYWVLTPLIILLIVVLQFFRSPSRQIVPDALAVLSPADGKVVVVEEAIENEFFKKPMLQVSIFMSPFNVHVNRYPVAGQVVYQKYHPGKFLVAWHPKSSELNERTSIGFETQSKQRVFMRQVAGLLARRIVCYSKEGMKVKQGEELGFIKFGSRCDIFLPLDAKVNVKMGDKVKGGLSKIASLAP